ncbi:sigma-70 family RNA polymerase sigma factor [Flavobacterium sp. AS60]|uniref:sigma-70 family RNA polymerase sigma factor n=1 Tax=Flavobacterium anseongense TaxID=2910677 RepID=UPI001F31D14D|nr:sigma-70 family RNA polymerase sigma factor [Flavobacterium sp. AS60]MCF6128738.1 sigma-70 family RNA polymerase sigma factor [Flavobacterium sp. AS60]
MKKDIALSTTVFTSESLWETYAKDLERYIFSQIKDVDTTNDVLQEIFIKIHLNIATLQKKESIKSWVFTIAHNTLMNFLNKKSIPFPIEDIADDFSLDEEIHSAKSCLLPMIKNLPEKYREPLLLSEIKGKKQSEVAKLLGITLSGAKSRIQRGRKLLQQGFMDCCQYKLNKEGYLVGEHQEKADCKLCK